ncbi:hypothetical protein FPHYL_8847 [Fusarium phyllophilum]|uniref:Uncharacterized protein n=1 Tax=Fusarium phyllophilum TaxID=47803 RepID=A0A8H5N555_9HYPO|nr:hypothetical protein FPHYL_8847 [Fusarium phyllophilum]
MASNNGNMSSRVVNVGGPHYDPDVRSIADNVDTMLKEREKLAEKRAHVHFSVTIADLESRLNNLKRDRQGYEYQNAWLREELKAWEKRAAEAEAKAKVDADARIAQHTYDLQSRNAQMVETVAETVDKLKRDAAARVAAAEAHADSQVRELSRDRDRNADMVGLARKHVAWGQHKLRLLLEKVYSMGCHHEDPLAVFVYEICEEFGEFRNECDEFLDNRFPDDNVPDLGPVPEDEGGALFSKTYRNFPEAISPGNTGEQVNQPEAEVSPSGGGTASHIDSSPSIK